ncbi:O-antigen ligase family protein [Parahaliea aestuarii]|nr:O-antigen ligase family protein [Parahaliea aestuarii]
MAGPCLLLLLVWASVPFTLTDMARLAAQLLVLAALVLSLRQWRDCLRHPLCWLLLAALALQLTSWGLSHWLHPQLAERSPRLHRLAAWFFLIPVALFAGGARQGVALCWLSALLALLLLPWTTGNGWEELGRGIGGERVSFGLLNAQHTALLFGAALLGVWLVPANVLAPSLRDSPAGHLARPLLIASCLYGVLLSQTRGVWLALLCGIAAAVVFRSWRGRRLRASALLLPLVLVMASPLGDAVYERLQSESPGNLQENVRVRLATWDESMHWIAQRPALGWGGQGRAAVVRASAGLSDDERNRFRHLHSSYLDILVNWGGAGLLLYATLLGWLSLHFWRSWRGGILPEPVFTFWCAFLPYWLVANGFESFVFYQSGAYLFALVAGGCLALCRGERAAA